MVMWYESFRRYAEDPQCSNPAVLVRNAIQQHLPIWHNHASRLVSAEMHEQRARRMDTITDIDAYTFPAAPALQNVPIGDLEERILQFNQTIQNIPYRYVPSNRVRAERSQYAVMTAQFQAALDSPYGRPLHLRNRKYLQEQEFLFRANVQEQLNRYSSTPPYDYSGANESLPTYAPPTGPVLEESSEEEPIKSPYNSDNAQPPSPPRSPNTLRLLEERKKAALRRQEELQQVVSSHVSRTSDRINTQIEIDTAEGTTGTSSSGPRTSRRSPTTLRSSRASEEARSPTPDTNVSQRTRSQSLRHSNDTNIKVLRPTIIRRSDSGDTDSDESAGNNINSFAALSVMSRQQLASTYDQQQRQFRKRIASESSTMHVASNQPRVLRLPLEFSSDNTTDNDAYTYVITQPQSASTPPAPTPANDANRG